MASLPPTSYRPTAPTLAHALQKRNFKFNTKSFPTAIKKLPCRPEDILYTLWEVHIFSDATTIKRFSYACTERLVSCAWGKRLHIKGRGSTEEKIARAHHSYLKKGYHDV